LINWIEVLLDSLDHDLELLLVLSSHQKVLAQVLVASAVGMALIEAEYFVDGGFGAHLECYHFAGLRAQLFVVGGVLQFPVRLVAGTLLGVLTTVQTVAKVLASRLLQVPLNVLVDHIVLSDVIPI
jgi:hypothetical protein